MTVLSLPTLFSLGVSLVSASPATRFPLETLKARQSILTRSMHLSHTRGMLIPNIALLASLYIGLAVVRVFVLGVTLSFSQLSSKFNLSAIRIWR